MEIACDNV